MTGKVCLATRVRYRQSCGLDTWSVLLAYLSVSRIYLAGLCFCFYSCFIFFPSPPIRSGEAFSSVIFPLFLFFYLFFGCSDGMEREACVCDHRLERWDLLFIIISAHKSDLSYPWSQTQASLSIPSLHQKNTNKRREREEKNNRRENIPRSDRRGREKIKQEQKNKSKDPPRISERQIDNKQARQTKCQDHTNCRYRTRVAKHTPPVAGRGAADSQALRQGAPV